jgi:sec-independent protein translocase protein TatA
MQELLIILVVVLVLFGGKKLPELARGLGQGMKEFKKATRETATEEESSTVSATTESRP